MANKSRCAKLYKKGSKLYNACVSAKPSTSDPVTERLKKSGKKWPKSKKRAKVIPEQHLPGWKPPFYGVDPRGTGEGKKLKKRRKKWKKIVEKHGR
jgi:hypothetical protein